MELVKDRKMSGLQIALANYADDTEYLLEPRKVFVCGYKLNGKDYNITESVGYFWHAFLNGFMCHYKKTLTFVWNFA